MFMLDNKCACLNTIPDVWRLCGHSVFSAGCSNSPCAIACVHNRYKIYINRHKHTQSFNVVRQLPTSTGLCPDVRFSTNLIQGL